MAGPISQFQQLQPYGNFGLQGMAPFANADWSRIHDLGTSSSRQGATPSTPKQTVPAPVSASRGPGSGYPLHDYPAYGARPKRATTPPVERPAGNPYKFSATMQAVLDKLEAEENAESQL